MTLPTTPTLVIQATVSTDFLGIKHILTNSGNTYLITPKNFSDFTWQKNTAYKWNEEKQTYVLLGDASLANNLLELATPGEVQPIPPDSQRPIPLS